MNERNIRLGVDIGGTFTDVVLEVAEEQHSAKMLTTYSAPEEAIITGMHQVCIKAGINPAQIQQIIHGTTLATNALIERNGAKTALITTQGFRDVIEMRTESRFEQYDLNLELPPPLIPRQQRFTLNERISAAGNVLIPLQRSEVESLANKIINANFESVAVGFLHSYVKPEHEQMVRKVFTKKAPDMMISLSCEVSPQMREYERFNTVVANAYIKPLMKSYLDRLEHRLHNEGVICNVFLMHSGGGIISLKSAAEFPVRLVESGPAGGAVFAANIATKYNLNKVVSFDMGGTTAKICLINNQTPKTSRVFEVARTYRFKKGSGMPISIPVIDMVEIGAGGGSLARVDSMQQIRVGPESAGSEPGPACYGQNGQRPTVTDADLLLGKLDPDNFAGGTIMLYEQNSKDAIDQELGRPLNMETQTAAYGLVEVVDENMANAARVHAVENGEDLNEYTMIAFGGAAPLHAGRLCEKLNIERLLVPSGAGVGSAIGFLCAPYSFEANRSMYMRLSEFNAVSGKQLFDQLNTEARDFVRSCTKSEEIISEYKIFMRYSGQGWEIPVSLSEAQATEPNPTTLLKLFETEYINLFGRAVEGIDVEITVWSVNAITARPTVKPLTLQNEPSDAPITTYRPIFDPALGQSVQTAVLLRDQLHDGHRVDGPAAITESETTIIVPSSRSAIQLSDGCIEITKQKRT